ncbi:hypothetical protein [Bradyrhizobium elkanii]|uniref:hypothetical protein n=1 Tax=Bradyrhizobium elkanii TaxID=29448 RepID=UPI00272A1EC2|nr:hypothetical protein [Bradyrhizobium elkanii]WLA78990.1 hypothetical protein QNJ99_26635 [Bradyrhizobium elkanii]
MPPANAFLKNIAPQGNFVASRQTASKSSGRYEASSIDFISSFYAVLNRWRSETAFESDPDSITAHPSFAALVEHADIVCPLIIQDLRMAPSNLVWVLDDAFPNETTYSPSDVGDFVAMSNGWIAWAEMNGRTL